MSQQLSQSQFPRGFRTATSAIATHLSVKIAMTLTGRLKPNALTAMRHTGTNRSGDMDITGVGLYGDYSVFIYHNPQTKVMQLVNLTTGETRWVDTKNASEAEYWEVLAWCHGYV